jgi:hypothetical protein
MKKIVISFAFLASIAACNETKKVNTPEPEATVPATPAPAAAPQKEIVTVTGKVEEIVNGKDGYTAKINSTDGVYFITASIPNSTDPKNYRRVAVGETVTVKGEQWMQGTEKHIVVREFVK